MLIGVAVENQYFKGMSVTFLPLFISAAIRETFMDIYQWIRAVPRSSCRGGGSWTTRRGGRSVPETVFVWIRIQVVLRKVPSFERQSIYRPTNQTTNQRTDPPTNISTNRQTYQWTMLKGVSVNMPIDVYLSIYLSTSRPISQSIDESIVFNQQAPRQSITRFWISQPINYHDYESINTILNQ